MERVIALAKPQPAAMLRAIDRVAIEDVMSLSRRFFRDQRPLLKSFKSATLGATLVGSQDIGGADCDLIVDGCLIELKSSLRPYLETMHLRQLVGYWLLDYDDTLRLSSAAIILLRHGLTHRFSLIDLVGAHADVAGLRADFRDLFRRSDH
jgi:hypothetical protein